MTKKTAAASLLLLSLCFAAGGTAQSRFERSAQPKRELVRNVEWPTHEPVMFWLRRGRHWDDLVETYARQHDPDNIRAQLAAGVVTFTAPPMKVHAMAVIPHK